MLYHNKEWGVGNGEWEMGNSLLYPHSPLPIYCPMAETTINALAEDAKWPAAPAAAVSIFVLAARADFVEKPDTLLGIIQNLLKRVAGRRVAVLLAYLDRGALPFG
jgi:hypothetical protein